MVNTRGSSSSMGSYSRSQRPFVSAFRSNESDENAGLSSGKSLFLKSRNTNANSALAGPLASGRKRNVDELYEDDISDIYDSNVSNGQARNDISESAIPALPRRVASIVPAQRKINWSLLQGSDTRVPGYLIVELYREALENRALQQKVQQRQKNSNEIGPELGAPNAPVGAAPSRSSCVSATARTNIPARRIRESSPQLLKRGSLRPNAGGVTKAKPRAAPIKSRIQLVSKPLIDISKLPEERKKGPGFYTANFEVSDSESDEEPEPDTAADPLNTKPDSELVRRPQILSNKLKNQASKPSGSQFNLAETDASPLPLPDVASASKTGDDKPDLGTAALPKFSFGAKKTPNDQGSGSEQQKFSFGAQETRNDNKGGEEKPKFSFGGLGSSTQPPVEKPAEKPADEKLGTSKTLFSLGSNASSETTAEKPAKPTFSFGGSGGKSEEKPQFSFGSVNGSSTNAGAKPAEPLVAPPAAGKQAFSFGSIPAASETSAPAKPSLFGSSTLSSDAKPSPFGSATSAPTETPKPAFPAKPDFVASTATANSDTAGVNGNSGATSPSPFLFGSTPSATSKSDDKITSDPSTSAPAPPKFQFGAPASSAAKPSAPAFTFGASSTTTKPSMEKTALFGTSSEKQSSTPKFSFGAPSANASPGFTFGKPAASAAADTKPVDNRPADPTPAKPSMPFQSTASSSSAAPKPPAFNLTQSATKASAFTPSSFAKPSESQPATSSTFAFGAPTATTDSATPKPATGVSIFGASNPAPSTNGATTSLFGAATGSSTPVTGTTAPATTTATTPFTFGAPPAAAANSTLGAGTAGTGNSDNTPFTFGQSSKQSTPFSFAAGGAAPATSTPPTPAFGGFGAPAATTGGAFGQPASGATPFGSKASTPQAGFTFGAPAGASAFGQTAAPSAFGASPATMGGAFGTANTSNQSTFGSRESTPGLPGAGPAGIPGRKMARVKRLLRK